MKKMSLLYSFITVSGFFLPSIIGFSFILIRSPDLLFPLKELIGVFFLSGLLNSIPFIVIVALIKITKNTKYIPGNIGAVVAVSGVSIFLNIIYWLDLTSKSPSSTGSLIFFFLPFYGCFSIPFGYLMGLFIDFLFRKKLKRNNL
jgi:hypothetical protein